MSSIKRSVLIYACAFAVAGAVPFLLLPVLTRYLSPTQFGEVTAFLMFAALLGNFASLSAHGFVAVRYFKMAAQQLARIVGTSVSILVLSHLLALVIVWLAHPLLVQAFDLPLEQLILAVLAAFFMNLCLVWLALFQSSGQAMHYLQARLIQGGLELILCIGLLMWILTEPMARTASYVLALAASALFGLRLCWRRALFAPNFELAQVRSLLVFGVPLLPHIVAGTTILYLDRLVVSSVLGNQGLGLYMVSMQIGMTMVALTEPLNKALAPWLFEQLSKNDDGVRRMIVRRTYQLFLVLVLIGLIVAVLANLLFDHLIDSRYEAAKVLVPWMVGGFVMQGLYTSVVNYLFYAERTGWLSMVSASTAVLGCGVSWIMVTHYGIQGAAMSFAFNSTLLFVMVWAVAARAVPMPWLPGSTCRA
jgi:O-antigen/teichoic acid export membrane protein